MIYGFKLTLHAESSLFPLCCALALASMASGAAAQPALDTQATLQAQTLRLELARLEHERDSIPMRPARAGTIVGGILAGSALAIGLGFLVTGIVWHIQNDPGCDDGLSCEGFAYVIAAASFSMAMLTGGAILTPSAIHLGRNKRRRAKLDARIQEHRRALSGTNLSLSLARGGLALRLALQ